jgi:protein ImuA
MAKSRRSGRLRKPALSALCSTAAFFSVDDITPRLLRGHMAEFRRLVPKMQQPELHQAGATRAVDSRQEFCEQTANISLPLHATFSDSCPADRLAPPFGPASAGLFCSHTIRGSSSRCASARRWTATGLDAETGTLTAAFAAALLAGFPSSQQVILWVAQRCDLYPPGLSAYGLDPARLLLVQTMADAETLKVVEAALRQGGAAAVVGEVGELGRLAARRVQLACGKHGITAFALRRWPYGRKQTSRPEGNAAATRWCLHPEPSQAQAITTPPEPGSPRWRVGLLHARGGRPGAWIMERNEIEDVATTHPLRVVAALADYPPAPRATWCVGR